MSTPRNEMSSSNQTPMLEAYFRLYERINNFYDNHPTDTSLKVKRNFEQVTWAYDSIHRKNTSIAIQTRLAVLYMVVVKEFEDSLPRADGTESEWIKSVKADSYSLSNAIRNFISTVGPHGEPSILKLHDLEEDYRKVMTHLRKHRSMDSDDPRRMSEEVIGLVESMSEYKRQLDEYRQAVSQLSQHAQLEAVTPSPPLDFIAIFLKKVEDERNALLSQNATLAREKSDLVERLKQSEASGNSLKIKLANLEKVEVIASPQPRGKRMRPTKANWSPKEDGLVGDNTSVEPQTDTSSDSSAKISGNQIRSTRAKKL